MAIEIVSFPINSMVIFHSYVKLPEGKSRPSSPLLVKSLPFPWVKLQRTHFLHLPASGASASDRMAAKATSPICAKKKYPGLCQYTYYIYHINWYSPIIIYQDGSMFRKKD
jgi:hypothetical protein